LISDELRRIGYLCEDEAPRRRERMRVRATAGICLAATMVAASGAQPARASPPPLSGSRSITLITGDRLLVSPDGTAASRLPAPGRDQIPLLSQFVGGHLEVVPADAVPLLNGDRLDRRLFDIAELLADGYDDARGSLPLIITYAGANPASALRAVAGGAPVRDLDTINGAAVRVDTARTAAVWQSLTGGQLRPAYRKVWLDGVARPSIDVSVPLVGAPAAWAAGYTGGAVPVGVLDTGVDATHPDLAQSVAASADFTDGGDGIDRVGHGTHVASIIAGSGAASAGRYRGMAPDVRLYAAKVCRADGCPESSILAGMQWAARDEGLKVVNLSLGRPDEPGTDLLEQAVDMLSARYGTLFVVAAGNDHGRVSSPGSADAALTVGASTMEDTVAAFSGRGPRPGDGGVKPDLVAPGVGIVAARSRASSLPPLDPDGLYTRLSGTSMAAAHVTGAAALLAQEHPDWTPALLKAGLMNAATPISGGSADQAGADQAGADQAGADQAGADQAGADRAGAGRLDVAKAVASPVLAQPASLSFGRTDAPSTQTVTYRNSGPAPVTLDLSLASNGPAGAFALDADRLTVPAGGDASVVVGADLQVPGAAVRVTGTLTASGGDVSIRTPIATERAPEMYRLTVRYRDRAGAPAPLTYGGAYALDGTSWTRLPNAGGAGTVSLPKGTYMLDAKIFGDGDVSLLNQPALVLDKDTTVDMDARLGRPIQVPAPRAGAAQVYAHVGVTFGPARAGTRLECATFDGLYTAQIGGIGDVRGFRTDVAGSWAQMGSDGTARNSPYLYSLAWSVDNRYVTGFARTIRPRDLATVRAEYGADAPGATGTMSLPFAHAGDTSRGSGYTSTFDLPFARTEYHNAGDGLTWGARFGAASGPFTAYTPGRTFVQAWNRKVFGPAFPPPNPWANEVSRTGDALTVNPSWFSDSSGEHGGPSMDAAHHLTVVRDGAVISDTRSPSVAVTVQPAAGVFTVTDESTRAGTYSTTSRTAWTFRSGRVAKRTMLPLSAIRFTPGPGNVLSFAVQHQSGSAAGPTTAFRLQVSYDDGQTWRNVLCVRVGDRGVAILRPPAAEGFVSLKASAADAAGDRVEQRIVRAY
jgi:subtilisin family serine protease